MTTAEDSQVHLVFRSYTPRDASLQRHCLPQPVPIDAAALLASFNQLDINALDGIDDESNGTDLSLAPKNANWDLKRDLSKQLAVLEHQTQKAIIEMVREKVARQLGDGAAEGEANDLNEAIDAQSRRAEAGLDDNDDDDDNADDN